MNARAERRRSRASRPWARAARRAAFARPETLEELQEALAWAGERESPVATVGLGSNLLVADEGFDGPGAEARRRARGGHGGGRAAARRRRRRERGLPPPCTGGRPRRLRVRVRDPRHDRRRCVDERRRLRQRLGDDPRARARRGRGRGHAGSSPEELGLSYRHSGLHHGQVVARAEFRSRAAAGGADQGERRAAPGPAQGRAADEQTDVRKRLQEPRARADRGPDARGLRTEGPPDRRRADLAASRELHRERRTEHARPTRSRSWPRPEDARSSNSASSYGTRSSSSARSSSRRSGRSADRRGESRLVPERRPQRARARAAVIPLPGSMRARSDSCAPFRADARCCSASRSWPEPPGCTCSHGARRCSRSTPSRSQARHRASLGTCAPRFAPLEGSEPVVARFVGDRPATRRASRHCGLHLRPRLPAHAPRDRQAEHPVAVARRGAKAWLVAASSRVIAPLPVARPTRPPEDLARPFRRPGSRRADHAIVSGSERCGRWLWRASRTSAAASGWCARASTT